MPSYIIWIGLFSPLVGFLILLVSSRVIGRHLTGLIGCGSLFISFLCFSTLLYEYLFFPNMPVSTVAILYNWVPVAGIQADFAVNVDPLSLLMTMIITGVGFLIHVYSNGYMEHEEDFARYFACLNFFVFSMLTLVLAANLLLLFVGWEGVGLASYLLIGFDYHRPSAAVAAVKAFVVNRIGDLGLLLGILLTFYLFGTSDITHINGRVDIDFARGAPILVLLAFLYFCGAAAKSAQLPLHVWLPDAMEGPTPVSALIHAATMVTAGVYLIVRMHPVFLAAPTVLYGIGLIGALTALFASLSAIGQTDLKRVLAYSTVSQLGLMFLACGAGAFYAAMFHLTMHAFVKGLLFLAAGNVVHMMHGVTDMTKMGGLWKKFPRTHICFLIGALSMSGIPPLAIFFSKDLILEQEFLAGYDTLYTIGLLASIMTAFYLTRAYVLAFTGAPRLDDKHLKAIHEAPAIMLTPVGILAFLSLAGGFLGFAIGKPPLLEDFLEEVDVRLLGQEHGFVMTPETWLSVVGAFFGVALAAWIYSRFPNRIYDPIMVLRKAFYFDEIYEMLIVRPLKALSHFVNGIMEPRVFEGSTRGVSQGTYGVAGWLQRVQSGEIRSYLAMMVIGTALLIVYFIY